MTNPVRTRFVKEKDKIRWATNLKPKNDYIRRQYYPLPNVEHMLRDIGCKRYFSKIDMKSGFFQIRLTPESRNLTAFITYRGTFVWNVIPQGVNIGSEAFQVRMEEIFSHIPNLKIFIDDLIIATNTIEEHLTALRQVLDVAKRYKLHFNAKKIDLFKDRLKILGHIISNKQIHLDESKYEMIRNITQPKNSKDTQRILGFFSYFRDHLPDLARIVHPLYEVTKQGKFVWGLPQQNAFETVKQHSYPLNL